jgi:Flp pilus assembly protein TadG
MRTISRSLPTACPRRSDQRGAAIIEFAFVAMIFITLLIGIMEFGRWLFTLNAAGEATRLGARLAVVCSKADEDKIKDRMRGFVSTLTRDTITIEYQDGNGVSSPTCITDWTSETNRCEFVMVQLNGAQFTTMIPFLAGNYNLPPFTTTLTREFMKTADNPVCPL